MTKRRITKASKRRLTVFGTISLIAIVYFCVSLLYNGYAIYSLSNEKKQKENELVVLKEKAEDLKQDIEKLNDPQYLADYARENYLYSKEDEYILQIEEIVETTETIDSISTTINKNYLLLIFSIIIFLMFIYIFVKSTKKTEKK